MKQAHVNLKSAFQVIIGNSRSQAAEMTLPPGKSEGGPDNRHKGADQWLFVVSGRGVAIVNGKTHRLAKWTLLLIERGDTHEIRNTGRTPLRTLNFYVPPAYTPGGNEKPAGKAN
jgi:mannose-6-phosphate isomerase-like protein (cupin superfamily)